MVHRVYRAVVKSSALYIGERVPQGSILGPTLFSVYINEVALAAGDYLIHLYADDTILYTSGTSLDTSVNAIQLSFHGLQLLLNASKTKCMLFNRLLPAPACTLDGSDLEYVDIYKYLGVWLTVNSPSRLTLNISNPKLNLKLASYFATKPPSLMLPNIPL